jgi:hypothetical protein
MSFGKNKWRKYNSNMHIGLTLYDGSDGGTSFRLSAKKTTGEMSSQKISLDLLLLKMKVSSFFLP